MRGKFVGQCAYLTLPFYNCLKYLTQPLARREFIGDWLVFRNLARKALIPAHERPDNLASTKIAADVNTSVQRHRLSRARTRRIDEQIKFIGFWIILQRTNLIDHFALRRSVSDDNRFHAQRQLFR